MESQVTRPFRCLIMENWAHYISKPNLMIFSLRQMQFIVDWFFYPLVESPIIEHILIIEHYSIFYSFLNQIGQFLCNGKHKLKGYKCSLRVKSKEQCKEHRKRMSNGLFQVFWKNSSRPLISSSLISSSFLICFEWFETSGVCQLGLYKTSLYCTGKDATS
jgi:hypothetical protein